MTPNATTAQPRGVFSGTNPIRMSDAEWNHATRQGQVRRAMKPQLDDLRRNARYLSQVAINASPLVDSIALPLAEAAMAALLGALDAATIQRGAI